MSLTIFLLLIILVCIVIIGSVLNKGGGSGSRSGGATEISEVLRLSRQRISRLGFLSNKLNDAEMSGRVKKINQIATEILQTLNRSPEKVSGVRFFLDYYLPVLIKLIEDYNNLKRGSVSNDASAQTKANMAGLIKDVEIAFQKQLDALSNDVIIDIDAEIKVFTKSLREDGLIPEDYQPGQTADNVIEVDFSDMSEDSSEDATEDLREDSAEDDEINTDE